MGKWFYKFFGCREIKEFFSFKEGETFGRTVAVITIASLIIQIMIIILSLFFPKSQFGPPDLNPFMLIVLTLISLMGYRGYLAVFFSLVLFIASFGGTNILSHPAFYHTLAMILYAAGWTAVRRLHPAKSKETDVQEYQESYVNIVVHKSVFNVTTQRFGNTIRTTWLEKKSPIVWPITRPREGKENSYKECPVCHKQLKIINVCSSKLAKEKWTKSKRTSRIWNRVFCNFLFAIVPFLFLQKAMMGNQLIAMIILSFVTMIINISYYLHADTYKAPDGGKGTPVGIDASYMKAAVETHYMQSSAVVDKLATETLSGILASLEAHDHENVVQ